MSQNGGELMSQSPSVSAALVPGMVDRWHHLIQISLEVIPYSPGYANIYYILKHELIPAKTHNFPKSSRHTHKPLLAGA